MIYYSTQFFGISNTSYFYSIWIPYFDSRRNEVTEAKAANEDMISQLQSYLPESISSVMDFGMDVIEKGSA